MELFVRKEPDFVYAKPGINNGIDGYWLTDVKGNIKGSSDEEPLSTWYSAKDFEEIYRKLTPEEEDAIIDSVTAEMTGEDIADLMDMSKEEWEQSLGLVGEDEEFDITEKEEKADFEPEKEESNG